MIKFFLLLFFSISVSASTPFVELSVDKSEYLAGEKSVLMAELMATPTNSEFEFFLEASLNETPVELQRITDFVWSEVSEALTVEGVNLWEVSLYFINKTLYAPMRAAILAKEAELAVETDPNSREELEEEIAQIQDRILDLRRHVKDFSIEFTVLPGAKK